MKDTKEGIRILIADDHPMFRDGLRAMLQSKEDFTIVGEAKNGNEAVELARQTNPDVILLDVSMPGLSGFDVLRELSLDSDGMRAILLTAGIAQPEIVQALQLGARGVVWKESSADTLFKSIRCVMQEQVWISRECVRDLVDTLRTLAPEVRATELPTPRAIQSGASTEMARATAVSEQRTTSYGGGSGVSTKNGGTKFGLTPRELEIVGAIVDGQSNRDIALNYSISEYTVKHHLTRIFDKVGVFSRLELAMFAIHHGLQDLVQETTRKN